LFKKIICDTSENKNFSAKLKQLISLLKFYNNFRKGISSGKIYHELTKQNQSIIKIKNQLEKDSELIDNLLNSDVKNFLQTKELENYLDFDKRKNSFQIGLNTIYIDKPISGLWTTGKATFYLPTRTDLNNKIKIELRSIPPVEVSIGIENDVLKNFMIPKLSSKEIIINIPINKIHEKVSEIFISTDKLWLPNIILGTKKSLTLGIGIKSIQISYF